MTKALYRNLGIVLVALAIAVTAAYVSDRPPSLSQRCVQALAALAKPAGATVTPSGDRISIGGKEVHITAEIENEERADKGFLVGLRVDISINGVPQPFTFGSVGLGNNRDEAVETAISEWTMYVGRALLGALGAKTGDLQQVVGAFTVYPGLTGIRGSGVVWAAEKDRQLLDHFNSVIRELEHSLREFHSISLVVAIQPDGTSQGECRVDGAISPAALTAVQSFPWSKAGTAYIFKHFYVVRRR